MLTFNAMPGLFKSVQVTGLGSQVELGAEGGAVVHRAVGREPVTLQVGYRFVLAADAQPGNYPWPIVVSAQPL